MEALIPEYTIGGMTRERSGAILPGIAPSNVYPCQDGDYLIGANQDGIFRRLAQAMGRPGLADDPKYATHAARGERQGELDALIGEWTRELTIAEVEAKLIAAGVPAGRIYRAPEMLEDPHFKAREAIVTLPHPRWGEVAMQNVFPKLSRTPGKIRSIAPQTVGQDNDGVWGTIVGLDGREMARLRSSGVI